MIKYLLSGLVLAILCFTTYDAQGAMFLKIESIPGSSTVSGHENQIEISSFQFGVSNHMSIGGGGGSGKADFSDLQITKIMDKSSPPFFTHALNGKVLPKAEIFLTKDNKGGQFTFAHYTLQDVMVSSYSVSSGGDTPSESLGLNYKKLVTENTPQNPDGSPGQAVVFCWDNVENKICSPPQAPSGSFNDPSNEGAITLCPVGTFTDTAGQSSCTHAPAGSFVDTPGSTSATLCPAGTYCPNPQMSTPLACPAGDFCAEGSVTPDTPPAILITSPTNGVIVSTATPTVSGSASDDTLVSSISWKVDSGPISTVPGIIPAASILWSFGTSALSPGQHTIQVNATDQVGLVTISSVSITYAAPTATLPPPSGSGQISFNANSGGFTSLNSISQSSLPTPPPAGGSYPLGFFSWSITNFAPATSVTVKITSPTTLDSHAQYFKLIGGNWVNLSPVTISGHTMTIIIIDNGPLDGNPTSGVISDPGAIATPTNGRVTGGGNIGKNTEFSFGITSDIDTRHSTTKGNLDFHDKSTNIKLDDDKASFLSVDHTTSQATFVASGTLDKHKGTVTALVSIKDHDKTGDHDTFSIIITDKTGNVLYHNSGNVKGHIEIHKFTDRDDKSDSGIHHNDDKDKNNDKNK